MDPTSHTVNWKGNDVSLTTSEFLLLQALAQKAGYKQSRERLMDAIHDKDTSVNKRTIDSHIKRIRQKMRAVDADFEAIETLYGFGYRFIVDWRAPRR